MEILIYSKIIKASFIKNKKFITIYSHKNIILFRCNYFVESYKRELFNYFNIKFPSSLAHSIVKRQAEYLAGRYTAITALNVIGVNPFDIPIGKHRFPLWPNNIIASITHTHNTALCVAGLTNDFNYIGVDRENWISKNKTSLIKVSILDKDEEEFLRKIEIDFNKMFTLIFSAKESLFKALFPTVLTYFNFLDVRIVGVCLQQKKIELSLNVNLSTELLKGKCFTCNYLFDQDGVQTLVAG